MALGQHLHSPRKPLSNNCHLSGFVINEQNYSAGLIFKGLPIITRIQSDTIKHICLIKIGGN